jgi:HAD superfamily hydrolase (TIGR01490 family)
MAMTLAIFDLDNTLLGGDSDYLWGAYLVAEGLVDGAYYQRENHRFYEEYRRGTLDIYEFLNFSLRPLAENPPEKLLALRERFMAEKIDPIILPAARSLIEYHRQQGHRLLIITATNRFITEPIALALGVEDLLATDPEFRDGRYTGRVAGTPSFREGKVVRLREWLKKNGTNLSDSWFYSDSHNDLPLLEMVSHPVAVDPDDTLRQHAEMKGWPIISLR